MAHYGIHSRVAIIGAGLLGTRIAGELALHGCTVHIYDHDPLTVQTVHSTIRDQQQALRDDNLIPPHLPVKGEVIVDGLLSSAVSDADIVFEAVSEDVGTKNSIFRDVVSICSSETILCTSTLTLPLEDIFDGVSCTKRTIGVRFLFPVYLIDTVEMMPWNETCSQTIAAVKDFLRAVKKQTFSRQLGEYPKKLSEEEAAEKQKRYFSLIY